MHDSMKEVYLMLRTHLKEPDLSALMRTIQEIPGDKRFRNIITQLVKTHNEEKRRAAKIKREARRAY
jgi:hypothetical protein